MLPLQVIVGVLTYVVMFGFYYHAWRHVFGGQAGGGDADAIAV